MANNETREPRASQELLRSFVDLVDGKFSVLLLEKVRALNTTEPDGAQIVDDFIAAVRDDVDACRPHLEAIINVVTERRKPEKVEAFRKILEDPAVGTPISMRFRNRIAYVVEQTVEISRIDELTRAMLARLREMVE